ncbi:hypothetical protein HerbRD11066_27290 [Herbidospora sp. RD11066]
MSHSPRMSKPALLAWLTAAALAAYPTWDEWRYRLYSGPPETFSCMGFDWPQTSPLDPLRGDLDRLMQNVVPWAVPALLVLGGFFACLSRGNRRSVGRRTAGALVLIAVIEPLTPLYSSAEECGGTIPILSAEWFAAVAGSWGSTQLCLLAAAAFVVLVTHLTSAQPEGPGVTWRRMVALLVDYAIVLALFALVIPLLADRPFIHVDYGLLSEGTLSLDDLDLEHLVVLLIVFLYFWVQHSLWGRTPGKFLLRIRLARTTAGRTALRTLIFPLLVFMPAEGLLVLVVDGLWALLDPDGRPLHDRWANTEVKTTSA